MTEPLETPTEPRNENVAVKVTASEKRAVRFVADSRGQSESDTMRDMTMVEIMAENERMRSILAENAA